MVLESLGEEGNTRAGAGNISAKPEDQEVDKEEFRSAKELIQFLIKTTRTLKIYLHNNPIHQKFLNELKERFDRYLEEYSFLKIQVQQEKLLLGQEVLYENSNRMESLAFRLYLDGIRELSFQEGLEMSEIKDFLEALGSDSSQSRSDDDIATLLWEKGFTHIAYQLAQESSQAFEFKSESVQDHKITKAFREEVRSQGEEAPEAEPPNRGEAISQSDQDLHNLTYKNVYSLTAEEIAKLKYEMQAEEGHDLLADMIQILTAILQIEEQPKDFEEVVKILQDMLQLMISRADFFHARRILEIFWELESPQKGLPETHRKVVQAAIDWGGSKEQIDKLKAILNNDSLRNLDHLYAYLRLLNKDVIPSLIDLLGSLNNMKSRRILCDAMVELGRDRIDILTARLRDPRWHIVRNVVYILGKIGDERVVDELTKLIHHSESQVRKEVVRTLETFPGAKAKQCLLEVLRDEDSAIRIQAVKSLAHHKVEGTSDHLLRIIEDGQFKDRDLYEKKEFFEALGRVGKNSILPYLQKILNQGTWFRLQKGREEELKLCAVVALKRVNTPEAARILKEGLNLKNKNIREACARVLSELERKNG